MGTEEFLKLVLPRQGNKILALPQPKQTGGVWFKYKVYPSIESVANAALEVDGRGETVYFAVSTFGDWYEDETTGKRRIRTQDNVVACRSLFDDFDVEAGNLSKYDNRKEALADIIKLAQSVKLTPTITSSGGGYHCYFSLDQDISREQWEELSLMKRDITTYLSMRVDRAVDMDSARILRPVGTHNRKRDTAVPVEIVKQGRAYSYEKVRTALESFIEINNVPRVSALKESIANPFAAALGEYPPSDAEKVAEHCAAIREFRDTGLPNRGQEPHWHRAIGVVKHCTDGESIIHLWSSKASSYSSAETQDKIDAWGYGPSSCDEMDKIIGCKAKCPHAAKVKSPIALGYADDAPSVSQASQPPAPKTAHKLVTIEGEDIPYWPTSGYRWDGSVLSKAFADPDGIVQYRPFCRSFLYPINRIKDSEGTWVIHWRAKEKNGRWREFYMPTLELAAPEAMAKTLASHEVFLTKNNTARRDMAEFAEGLIETLQAWRVETKTYKQFGWNEDRSGFIIGTKMITLKGEEDVLFDESVPSDIAVDFGTSGSLEDWVRNIDFLYNRKGAEPFQFALCHSMGSVLVELLASSNWHGLPLAFTGKGGTGKSTAAKVACGFYGRPALMEKQASEQGSTLNAAIKRIAVMGAVPTLLDELSGRQPDELTRIGYALANGRDKERLGSNGRFATVGGQWFKNSFITSNDSIHETISKMPAGYRVEATQLRFFEVQLPDGYRSEIFPDVDSEFIEEHMDHVYGEACRPYLRFILKNQDWVRRQLVAARGKFNPKSDEDNSERFYRDTIVTALVAGKIAERLGLVAFDLSSMKKWALDQVMKMRESRRESNIDISEHVAQFLTSLQGRLIVTKKFGDGRTKRTEVPLEQLRQQAVGRVCTEEKKFYVTAKYVSDWCKEHNVAVSSLREELDRDGYMIWTQDGKPSRRICIGSGTSFPSGQAWCYELQYDKVFSGRAPLQIVNNENTEENAG